MVRVREVRAGSVAVKSSHRELRGPEPLRMATILLDSTWTELLPIRAWIIEHPEGTILVDTGESARLARGEPGLLSGVNGAVYRRILRLDVRPQDEVGPRLREMGVEPEGVRRVVLTHLHSDHADGLSYFPNAEVVLTREEYENPFGALPGLWPDGFEPRLIDLDAGPYGPFPRSHPLTESGDVRLVATEGHTAGHLSVVVEAPDAPAVSIAGDASFTERQMLDGVVAGICRDVSRARRTLARIRRYVATTPTIYLPTHDPDSTERLEGSQTVPA